MFQRLKGAFDSIADEQARQRAAQEAPRRTASVSKRTTARTESPSTKRQPRNSHETPDRTVDLTGPDADPAAFDPDRITPQDGSPAGPAARPAGIESPSRTLSPDNQAKVSKEVVEAKNQNHDTAESGSQDLPADVQAKLQKLNRLEVKYQELLRAYRKAHARNAAIEPFEARLRESTPLTSIADPGAFVEYLGQLSQKGDLVLDELKRVSGENDILKQKLEEAERHTKDAYDEVAQLRKEKEGAQNTGEVALVNGAQVVESENGAVLSTMGDVAPRKSQTEASQHDRISSSEDSVGQKAAGNLHTDEAFLIDTEVSRLQAELHQATETIADLKSENEQLKADLSSVQESSEQMSRGLEDAQKTVEVLRSSLDSSREQSSRKAEADQVSIDELKSKLSMSEAEVEVKRTEIANQQQGAAAMSSSILSLESKLKAAEETMASKEAELLAMDKQTIEDRQSPGIVENHVNGEIDNTKASQAVSTPSIGAAVAKKKKTKNKKKKSVAATSTEKEQDSAPIMKENGGRPRMDTSDNNVDPETPSMIDHYKKQLEEKEDVIESLNQKLREQDGRLEEIEHLRDELSILGEEHVGAKQTLKDLEAEKAALQDSVAKLEQELSEMRRTKATNEAEDMASRTALQAEMSHLRSKLEPLQKERNNLVQVVTNLERQMSEKSAMSITSEQALTKLTGDFEDLKVKSKSLQTELSVVEQLAASRYKEMTSLRDLLQKAQPELATLRTEVSQLRSTKKDLAAQTIELRELQGKQDDLRLEIESSKRQVVDKDNEIKNLSQKIKQENSIRTSFEDVNRKLLLEAQRGQKEKTDAVAAREASIEALEEANRNLQESRTAIQQFEKQVEDLEQEAQGLRDEIALKTAQYASAQSLMSSVRDQATEMATQLREAKERCESLEEELTDAHRLMNERGREGETMRRLLSEVEQRAESRVKEMRERMDIAVQERDRAEDEANSAGRRRSRELDELRSKLHDMERELKRAIEDKVDVERAVKELRRQKEDDNRRAEQATQEASEARKAMSELRDALDEGEKQARDLENERAEVNTALEEAQQRLEKLQKSNKTIADELRSLKAVRVRPIDSGAQSSRSSIDSRITSPVPGGNDSSRRTSSTLGPGNGAQVDYVYLKHVLLQFLEQKDKKYQMQLVPVLGTLLHFDKKDEQRWQTVINAR